MTTPRLLTDDEITGRLQQPSPSPAVESVGAGGDPSPSSMSYFAPTSKAVESYIYYLNNDAAFTTGFKPLDLCFPGGLDRGDMFLVTGKSHSGKSTVAYNMVVHNLRRSEDFTAVLFSPDEPRELAMQKLFCIAMGRNALEVEDAIRRGDESAQRELENAANGLLDRVLINDQSLSFPQMLDAIWEAKEYWGAAPSACVIDYLELLHGTSDANGVAAKAQGAKRFAKDADVPLIVLHQTGRGASERGKPAGIHGARFGGENESVAVLECYRPKDRTDLSPRELTMVEDVVRLNLVKNKRPPYRLIDTEMILDPINGRIRELSIDDIEEREWIM